MRPFSPALGRVRHVAVVAAVFVACLALAPMAHAQRGRQTAAQRAAIQKQRQQMQAYQRDVQRYQKEMADKQAEIVKQYDENGDGRLVGPEKSKFDKYMFDVSRGRQPDPFAGILPAGKGREMSTANTKK